MPVITDISYIILWKELTNVWTLQVSSDLEYVLAAKDGKEYNYLRDSRNCWKP